MSNISEFERTKPTITMIKLKSAIKKLNERGPYAESRSEQIFLAELYQLLNSTVETLKKGE